MDIESEWIKFNSSIIEAAAENCGQNTVGACHGGNLVDHSGVGGLQHVEEGLLSYAHKGILHMMEKFLGWYLTHE